MNHYNAYEILEKALQELNINLAALVAATGLWANPKVHEYLVSENNSGAWRPNVRRAKSGETRRSRVDDVLLDDNTYVNTYIKAAIGLHRDDVVGFQACHIWPSSCYHPMHHTTIANLVLIPMPIAGLSDHSESVISVLKYRSFELYGWYPESEKMPNKPKLYPDNWLTPLKYSEKVQRSLRNRSWARGI